MRARPVQPLRDSRQRTGDFSGFTVHHEQSRSGCAGSVMLWTCRP